MLAQRRIADRVTPVYDPLLNQVVETLQSRWRLCQGQGPRELSRERVGQCVVSDICADSPVGALSHFRLEGVDQLPLAQRAHLVVHQVKDTIGVAGPVGLWFL